MEKYLRGRTDRKISLRFGKKTKVEHVPKVNEHETTIEQNPPSFWSRFFSTKKQLPEDELTADEKAKLEAMERDIDAVEEAEERTTNPEEIEALEEAREGMIERFLSNLRFFKHKHQVDDEAMAVMEAEQRLEEEKAEMDDDVKEVLRIAHTWLGKLTKRQKDAFKESEDFKQYVAVLEKYGVAKKK